MATTIEIMKYLIVLEPTATGYSAYIPDVPACTSTGKTRPEAEKNIREALELHLEGLEKEGREVPKPTSKAGIVSTDLEPECSRYCSNWTEITEWFDEFPPPETSIGDVEELIRTAWVFRGHRVCWRCFTHYLQLAIGQSTGDLHDQLCGGTQLLEVADQDDGIAQQVV